VKSKSEEFKLSGRVLNLFLYSPFFLLSLATVSLLCMNVCEFSLGVTVPENLACDKMQVRPSVSPQNSDPRTCLRLLHFAILAVAPESGLGTV